MSTEESELSDVELLASAVRDAVDAYSCGVLVGPALDEVVLRRAERRARCADAARLRRAVVDGGAA